MTYETIMTVFGYAAMAVGAAVMGMTFLDPQGVALDTQGVAKPTMDALVFSGAAMTLAGLSLVISSRKGK